MPAHMVGVTEEECRYCHDSGGVLLRPCACTGSMGVVHPHCLQAWLNVKSPRATAAPLCCEVCGERFSVRYEQQLVCWPRLFCGECSLWLYCECAIFIMVFCLSVAAHLVFWVNQGGLDRPYKSHGGRGQLRLSIAERGILFTMSSFLLVFICFMGLLVIREWRRANSVPVISADSGTLATCTGAADEAAQDGTSSVAPPGCLCCHCWRRPCSDGLVCVPVRRLCGVRRWSGGLVLLTLVSLGLAAHVQRRRPGSLLQDGQGDLSALQLIGLCFMDAMLLGFALYATWRRCRPVAPLQQARHLPSPSALLPHQPILPVVVAATASHPTQVERCVLPHAALELLTTTNTVATTAPFRVNA